MSAAAAPVATLACPRCGTQAAPDVIECPACGRHHRVYCRSCGHLNPREALRCEACMHQLRVRRHPECSPRLDRMVWPCRWEWRRDRRWLIPAQLAALIAAVVLGTVGIVALHTRFAVPRPETDDPMARLYVMPDGTVVELPEEDTVQKKFRPE